MSRNYSKIIELFLSQLDAENRKYFFKRVSLSPVKIVKISSIFTQLNIKNEDLLLLYSVEQNIDNIDVIITTKYLHVGEKSVSLKEKKQLKIILSQFPENQVNLILNFVDRLQIIEDISKKDLEYFTNKFKKFVNEKDDEKHDFEIDHEYLQILKSEGEKIQHLVEDLNSDKRFSNIINTIIQKTDNATEFKAEHIILQDIIKVFNLVYPLRKKKDVISDLKIKFLLAFIFEKLNGKDMISSLSISKINDFVKTEKFDENISIIREASLFNLGEGYKNEFLLPSILKRLNNLHFTNASSFLYRIASIIAKADNEVSEEEKKQLEIINNKLLNPKEKIKGVKQTEIDENETLDDVMNQLNELIGLNNIKTAIKELSNFLKIQKVREEKGLKNVNNALHSVFMGPPGTGKTTVARIVSKIYKHLGYLKKGHLVETDRTGMVAGYVGQTALKVDEVIEASIDGVLFIDEAYSLVTGNKKDFGNEAVEVLLKKMEDYRNRLVVIAAGYPDEMEEFIESNPGLQSRFNRYFTFEHYRPEELIEIFELFCSKNDFILSEDAREKLFFIFEKLYEKRHKNFGNARVARNLFEKIIEYHANRIVAITPLTEELLKTIEEPDVPPVNRTVEKYLMFKNEEEEL